MSSTLTRARRALENAPRRSMRLNKDDSSSAMVVQIDSVPTKKRKITSESASAAPCSQPHDYTPTTPRSVAPTRSSVSIKSESGSLSKREKALSEREKDFERRNKKLEEQLQEVSRLGQEAQRLIDQCELRSAKARLEQLEEHFTCALCYEIIASPYSLNPGACGHTFCATCILKWFFSRLHSACGSWHDYVDCPICRARVILTPDGEEIPRSMLTFPFVPNRTAEGIIREIMDKLLSAPVPDGGNADKKKRGRKRKRGTIKEEAEVPDVGSEFQPLRAWKEGGTVRAEWKTRDRDGRALMTRLHQQWSMLTGDDFCALKVDLGV
ncbi:hypothetical protein PLICRDRAFT_44302 [Plicaturopsis crispa FD-325 SS-3]|nr:hypothetical protein PLICRDRAFT_44302 [Plicaturopsis crispa FD-325 SS-3]